MKAAHDHALDPSPSVRVTVIDILLASLEALAAAGHADEACRLAGQACAALRQNDLVGWKRFNVLLHRLSREVS